MSGGQALAGADEELVGRCYTKARRLPLVLGELSGFRLWGGPYTVPQLVTMVIVLALMLLSHQLWARFGLLNVVPLVGVPYAVSFVVRQLRIEGRNPLAAIGSAAGLLVSPSQGRIAGRPLREYRRPVLVSGACTLTWRGTPGRVQRRAGEVVGGALGLQAVASPLPCAIPARAGVPAAGAGGVPGEGAVLSGAAALLVRARAGVQER